MRRALALVIAASCSLSGLALAHSTGHESRTVAHCEKLPTPERQACVQCVSRPVKHHYHPDYPAGARCRPDNGKP
jgi:hypothetical protein